MIDYASILMGVAILGTACFLQSRNSVPGDTDASSSEVDRSYYRIRRRHRSVVHLLLIVIGGLVIAAGTVGPGKPYLLLWASVPLVVLLIVILAGIDAMRTHWYHMDKLPELRKATMSSVQQGSEEGE